MAPAARDAGLSVEEFKQLLKSPAVQQSLAADGAIACFSSKLGSLSSDPDCAPQLKAGVRLHRMFQFEDKTVTEYGPCECCGDVSRLASGMVRLDGEAYAAYQVHWTSHQVARHGAEFYLILGGWGEGTSAADRFAVALHFFIEPDRFGFTVVDADQTAIASHPLVGRALSRERVIDTPLAQEAFNLVDAIWLQDENVAEVASSVPATA